jgi:hypothetical protein
LPGLAVALYDLLISTKFLRNGKFITEPVLLGIPEPSFYEQAPQNRKPSCIAEYVRSRRNERNPAINNNH